MTRWLVGRGLHGGAPSAVRFTRTAGPTTLGRGADRSPLGELVATGEDRATSLRLASGARIGAVEHLLAAIAGANAFDGLAIEIEGDEVPLLDGSAEEFLRAITALDPPGSLRRAVVTQDATFEAHGTVMHVSPSTSSSIEIAVDFPEERFGRRLVGEARWDGSASSFASIASARTFGAAREVDALRARGLAAHLPPGCVVALDLDDPAYAARDPDEPVRHKLLDAIGDLAVLGVRIEGRVRIERPSHRGTHAALARARLENVIRNS